jgi:hypothetical protein
MVVRQTPLRNVSPYFRRLETSIVTFFRRAWLWVAVAQGIRRLLAIAEYQGSDVSLLPLERGQARSSAGNHSLLGAGTR